MKTHYLIDYENVGIEGADKLSGDVHIYIFSSKNAAKLSTALLSTLNGIDHRFYEVHEGQQSVDKHLVSYLGYLIRQDGKDARYVIVSKDAGYDNVIAFWRSEQGVAIERRKQLCSSTHISKAQDSSKKVTDSSKRENQIRTFFGQNFKEQKYKTQKEKIIHAVLTGKSRQQVNVELQKHFPNSEVKIIYGRVKELLKDLPGK